MEDAPGVFGLHANADITFQQNETNALIEAVITMTGGGGGGGGDDGADAAIAAEAASIQSKISVPYDLRRAHPKTFATIESGAVNSLGVFLSQELVRFNQLINMMSHSLVQVRALFPLLYY